jgi:hypothetical protein
MSRAKPMSWERRAAAYAVQRYPRQMPRHTPLMTPRQLRRAWHKDNHAEPDSYQPVDVDDAPAMRPKGHATPRRADAIRGRLAGRRFLEARRA